MKKQTILKVRDTAHDVNILAKQVLALFVKTGKSWKFDLDDIGNFKETSALRRRSMDLTRLLAELRQNK